MISPKPESTPNAEHSAVLSEIKELLNQSTREFRKTLEIQNREIQSLRSLLEEKTVETAYQKKAANLLDRDVRTLQRWRKEKRLVEGVHWWPEDVDGAPIYNIPLIQDGLRQGFNSPPHIKACQRWLAQQPSNQRRKRKTSSP